MTRSRASARAAGSRFEREVADYLATAIDDRIDRRVKTGSRDKGDIAGLRVNGYRVVVECKNVARLDLAGWLKEAQIQAANDEAAIGIVAHKRRGVTLPARQWVTMELSDLVWLIEQAQAGR